MWFLVKIILFILFVFVAFLNAQAFVSLYKYDDFINQTPLIVALLKMSELFIVFIEKLVNVIYTFYLNTLISDQWNSLLVIYKNNSGWVFSVVIYLTMSFVSILLIWTISYIIVRLFGKELAKNYLKRSKNAIKYGIWEAPIISDLIDASSMIFGGFGAAIAVFTQYGLAITAWLQEALLYPAKRANHCLSKMLLKFEEKYGREQIEIHKKLDAYRDEKMQEKIDRIRRKRKIEKEREEAYEE